MVEMLSIFVLFPALMALGVIVLRHQDAAHRSATRRFFEVSFSRGLEFQSVEAFVRGLAGLQLPRLKRLLATPSAIWEVVATRAALRFVLGVEADSVDFVLGVLRSAMPAANINEIERDSFQPTLAGELRLSTFKRQLAVHQPESMAKAILGSLRPLEAGDEMILQGVIIPSNSPEPVHTISSSQSKTEGPSTWLALLTGRTDKEPQDKSELDKLKGPHFSVALRLGVKAKTDARGRQLLRRLTAIFHIANAQGVGFRRRHLPSAIAVRRIKKGSVPVVSFPCFLNGRELASLLAVPQGEVFISGLDLGRSRQLPRPASMPQGGAVVAVSNHSHSAEPLTFGPRSLPTHAWIVGATGSGKSTLLLNMLHHYMREGATVVLFDSKRDLVNDLVAIIPKERIDDLVLIDPADPRPVGINMLGGSSGDAERIADELVGMFVRLWPGNVGPRSADILRASFLTLAKFPGSTLVELPLLLTDDGYRRSLVSKLDDPVVLEPQWGAFDSLSSAERAAQIAAPLNKARAVLARKYLRDIVGQSQGLDLTEVLRRPAIVAIALSKGLVGEDSARLLGGMLLLLLWQALTARVALPASERRPVIVCLDEFQDYLATPLSLPDMLAQARSLNTGVVMAHQHVHQLPPDLRHDLRANARTKIAFGLSAVDAKLFADEFAPFLTPDDLQGLARYEVAAQVCVDGEVLPPATGTTLPPPPTTGHGPEARRRSSERFGKDRADIEAEIRARHGDRQGEGGLGRRRRG